MSSRFLHLALLLILLLLVPAANASHSVYPELQSAAAAPHKVGDVPRLRTGFHFQPPKHWINDPNGPMYYNGMYHLFYQYNPYGSVWGNIVWAHSVSKDLINWIAVEPAIFPTIPSDIQGCWSGSATVLPNGVPAILYTGIDSKSRQLQNIALAKNLSDPYLREWVKPDYNPIIVPTGPVNASAFRDPTTAWRGADGHWRLVVGSLRNHTGMAVLYRSSDFKRWIRAKRPLHEAGTGMWECPDFYPVALHGERGVDLSGYSLDAGNRFPVGVKHVLKVSLDLTRFEYYTLGTYDHRADRYTPDGTSPDDSTGLRYDYGNFYASKSFFDPSKGRRVLWGWANESDHRDTDVRKGWAGVQAIPRTVWLDPSGRQLLQWPVEEIEALRRKSISVADAVVEPGDYFEVQGLYTAESDVEVTFEVKSLDKAEMFDPSWSTGDAQAVCKMKNAEDEGGVGPFGLWVLASGDLKERTSVFFRVFKKDAAGNKHVVLMSADPTRSSYEDKLYKPTFAGFVDVDLAKTRKISLRTLIDNSVVESFGEGGKTCILSRVYPTLAVGRDAHLFVFNNGAETIGVDRLTAWEMKKPFMNQN